MCSSPSTFVQSIRDWRKFSGEGNEKWQKDETTLLYGPKAGTICGTFVPHKSGLNFLVLFIFLCFATNCDKNVVNLRRKSQTKISDENFRRKSQTKMSDENLRRKSQTKISDENLRRKAQTKISDKNLRRKFETKI